MRGKRRKSRKNRAFQCLPSTLRVFRVLFSPQTENCWFLSGRPLTHSINVDRQNNGGAVRGNWVSNPNLPSNERAIDRWFNTAYVTATPAGVGQIGNAGRNLIVGPGVKNFGLLLSRSFVMPFEGHSLQLRLESFNFTNTPAFGNPNTSVARSTSGKSTAQAIRAASGLR